jgi:3-methyladenine DNA glycosylase AlkD
MLPAQKHLRKFASKSRAKAMLPFYKTGVGQYGEGDKFLGISVPTVRAVAKNYRDLSLEQLRVILESPLHEERLMALVIVNFQYAKARGNQKLKQKIFNFYLKNRRAINNWDLVDVSAPLIPGDFFLITGNTKRLWTLAKSKRHWDRRIAMLSTFAFIRKGELDLVWKMAKLFLNDKEDLMHKATGWMLREAGKRDVKALRTFISLHGTRMPRTMLRYSIEKLSPQERSKILQSTKRQ